MTAEHGATSFPHDFQTTFDHMPEDVKWNRVTRPSNELECGEGVGTHRVDVAERVRCSDPAPIVWVINDWGEEVDGLDNRPILIDEKDPGVIEARDTYQEVRVERGWVVVRMTQDLRQLVRTELARSTGAV